MTISENRFSAVLPYFSMLVGALLFLVISDVAFTTLLAGKVSWTGINTATISQVLNAVIDGGSIATAVTSVVGAAAGGPLTAAMVAVGRGMLVKWVKRKGVKTVAKF